MISIRFIPIIKTISIELMEESIDQSQGQSLWKNENLVIKQFVEKPTNLQVYEFQVSGKTPKYIDNVKGIIFKEYSQSEYQFYEFLSKIPQEDQRSELKAYIPEYFGMEIKEQLDRLQEGKQQKQAGKQGNKRNIWIDHIASRKKIETETSKRFILLKNKTFGYVIPNIIDLKLGIKKEKKPNANAKYEKSTTNSHKFRINGIMVGLKEDDIYQQVFVSKYHGQKITAEQVESYLSLFFFNGSDINTRLIEKVIQQLVKLINAFNKFKGVKFISSSLFIAYDGDNPDNYTVNLIDFDKYQHTTEDVIDDIIAEGLVNVQKFLIGALKNQGTNLQKLKNKDLGIFKGENEVISEQAKEKYKK